jgi:hypothetical protein
VVQCDGNESQRLEQIEYHTVQACLRSPRVAVAYQRRSDWVYSARQVISSLSRVWGGAGASVMPLNDHGVIAKQLLPMFPIYDPDHVGVQCTDRG